MYAPVARREGGDGVGRVILLGTGDPLNEERAQSCLAVELAAGETMLVDASSGTVLLRQLATAGIALESVRHLFVTHRHFDHVGGLAPLLIALAAVPEASLTVHAAPATLGALRQLLALTIPGVEDWLGERLSWSELTLGRPARASDTVVTPFGYDHSIESWDSGLIRMTRARPSPSTPAIASVIRYAKGADLLVHEAYGPESGAEQAHDFGHSTAAEAGRVASEAEVGRLVLTHLRANRHTVPEELTTEAASAFGGPVAAARDLDAFDF